MTDLWKDSLDGIHPTVDIETGEVTYPEAEARLDERDGPAFEVLETLTEQDRLHREFQEKQYICPQCETKGMQYTSACPSCTSPETVRTERYCHAECGHEGIQEQFVDDEDGAVCPGCEMDLESLEHLELDTIHFCENCDAISETVDHRLRCRECHLVIHPMRATERILYQYYLTDDGADWIGEQLTARESIVETLENRTLRTETDTTVTDGSGEQVPVHVYAEDDLLDEDIVAAVHEQPDESDIRNLLSIALDTDAHAILVTTSGNLVGKDVDQFIDDDHMTVLQLAKGGTLRREYEIVVDPTKRNSFVGRIANIFRSQTV